jgi:EAL and modified HD-GYP domain-containing signal transduction protein
MSALISRYPVTNSQQDICAYRLEFRTPRNPNTRPLSYLTASDGWLLKRQNVLLSIDDAPTDQPDLAREFCQHILVSVDAGDEVTASKLKNMGFGIHLTLDLNRPLPHSLLQIATHISLPSDSVDLQVASKALRKFSAKQIARPITNLQEFTRAKGAGFDYVDGYYFSDVAAKTTKVINPAYTSIISVMQLAQQNAPIQKIEEALKRDAALSFRLLRYINSAGLGLSCEISSFRHAVTIIGYQNLYRWLSLLLVSAVQESGCPALMTTAVVRGRLAELLGASFFDRQERDNLFIVGVFSMLDVMLGMPMDKILDQIPLGENIVDALLHRQGNYGPFLDLAQCCERLDDESTIRRAQGLMELLQLTSDQVNHAHMQALGWTESLAL